VARGEESLSDAYIPEQRGEDVLGVATRDLEPGEAITLGWGPEYDVDTSDRAIEKSLNDKQSGRE
jgi:hypothetical protein